MKHIVVSGCSFTHNGYCTLGDYSKDKTDWMRDDIELRTWAHWLQDRLKDDYKVYNYGNITNDNKTIIRSVIYKVKQLLEDGVSPNDISVICQFSGLTRTSFFISSDKYHQFEDSRFANSVFYDKSLVDVYENHRRTGEVFGKACDYIETVQDDTTHVGYRRYEHGYHHLSGGGDPADGPNKCNNDFVHHYLTHVMSISERYFEWFEYIHMLLNFLKSNNIKFPHFFTMGNNFSGYSNYDSGPPEYGTPRGKSTYTHLVTDKIIPDTYVEDKKLEFKNGYVNSYAKDIDFDNLFWFYDEEDIHSHGGIIEWSIRNFDENQKSNLPVVLWREMNGMSVKEQKKFLDIGWYGHTSSLLARKFVDEVVLNFPVF